MACLLGVISGAILFVNQEIDFHRGVVGDYAERNAFYLWNTTDNGAAGALL